MQARQTLSLILLATGIVICAAAGAQFGAHNYRSVAEEGKRQLAPDSVIEASAPGPQRSLVSDWFQEAGTLYLLGIVVLATGAVLGRRNKTAADPHREDAATVSSSSATILLDALRALQQDIESNNAADLRARIDQVQQQVLTPVIEGSRKWQLDDVDRYAAIASALSASERKLNRTWSALADGHTPEAIRSLDDAAKHAELAARLDRDA